MRGLQTATADDDRDRRGPRTCCSEGEAQKGVEDYMTQDCEPLTRLEKHLLIPVQTATTRAVQAGDDTVTEDQAVLQKMGRKGKPEKVEWGRSGPPLWRKLTETRKPDPAEPLG